jgi:DNA-binding NarL/FixJ family response regulator
MALTGSTDREIAGRLRISVHTVKNHMRSVMSKCGVSKRIQLVPLLRGAPEQSS